MGKNISKKFYKDISPTEPENKDGIKEPVIQTDDGEKDVNANVTPSVDVTPVVDVTSVADVTPVADTNDKVEPLEELHVIQQDVPEVNEELIKPEIIEETESVFRQKLPRRDVPIPSAHAIEIDYTLTLDDIREYVETANASPEIVSYCLPLLQLKFHGQTSTEEETDVADETTEPNLGWYLSALDGFLRKFKTFNAFTGNEEMYLNTMKLIAAKRCSEDGDVDACLEKLLEDSKRFVKIYHEREVHSEALEHQNYWGTRQQMLSAKVIADWVDSENGPLDPIFGVLLHPTTGRVGPGDSGWIHDVLFDDVGHMAYHAAVHDAFGYLITWHNIGPGYDYRIGMKNVSDNCMSGQATGIHFWRHVMDVMDSKEKKVAYVSI